MNSVVTPAGLATPYYCRGLSPSRVPLQRGPDPLWTVKPEREGAPAAAAKAPAAAQLAVLPIYKDKPDGEQVGRRPQKDGRHTHVAS